MAKARGFPAAVLRQLDESKILGVRSGEEHRYTGVWIVIVEARAFVRSWNDKPTGWFRAFAAGPEGWIRWGDVERPVRGRTVRSMRLCRAVTRAYGEKYPTKGSRKWVEGFAEAHREATTLELVPR